MTAASALCSTGMRLVRATVPLPDRRSVICHRTGQPVGEIGMCRMEGQERYDRSKEILDILDLGLLPASGVGFLLLGEALG